MQPVAPSVATVRSHACYFRPQVSHVRHTVTASWGQENEQSQQRHGNWESMQECAVNIRA